MDWPLIVYAHPEVLLCLNFLSSTICYHTLNPAVIILLIQLEVNPSEICCARCEFSASGMLGSGFMWR